MEIAVRKLFFWITTLFCIAAFASGSLVSGVVLLVIAIVLHDDKRKTVHSKVSANNPLINAWIDKADPSLGKRHYAYGLFNNREYVIDRKAFGEIAKMVSDPLKLIVRDANKTYREGQSRAPSMDDVHELEALVQEAEKLLNEFGELHENISGRTDAAFDSIDKIFYDEMDKLGDLEDLLREARDHREFEDEEIQTTVEPDQSSQQHHATSPTFEPPNSGAG